MLIKFQVFDGDRELFRTVRNIDIDKWESLMLFREVSDAIEEVKEKHNELKV